MTTHFDAATLIVTIVLGLTVLVSYYIVFIHLNTPHNYLTHPFWFGIPKNIVIILVFFQTLAVVGFLMAMITWIIDPPEGGVMGSHIALPLTISVFLITASIWPFAVHYDIPWLVVVSLIGTAICSIVLLAGSIEETNQRWWVVLGFILLSIVTVIGDGVLWNANYIKLKLYGQ